MIVNDNYENIIKSRFSKIVIMKVCEIIYSRRSVF